MIYLILLNHPYILLYLQMMLNFYILLSLQKVFLPLQCALDELSDWMKRWELELAHIKCVVMRICKITLFIHISLIILKCI